MGYTPDNNPYIPGDPYSYDLKWQVDNIKHMQTRFAELDEQVQEATDQAGRAQDEADRAAGRADFATEEADRATQQANNAAASAEDAAESEAAARNYAENIADPVSGIVTEWLADHISQGYAVDNTLTISGAAADAKKTGDEIRELQGDLYKPTINKFNKKLVLENKYYVPGAAVPIKDSPTWNLTELLSVEDWNGSSDLWFKAYGFTDYSTGYRAFVYCFDSEGNYIATASSTTAGEKSFSGDPYRCKVFTLASGTALIRVQYYSSIENYNIGVFYAENWSETYIPPYVPKFTTPNDVEDIIDDRLSLESVNYGINNGINILNNVNAVGIIQTAFNSAKNTKIAHQVRAKLYGGRYSHDGTLAIDPNGIAYVAYTANAVDTGDSPSNTNAFVNLAIFNADTLSISSSITNKEIAKFGDSISDMTIISGCGVANLVIKNNIIIIIFSAKLSDNKWYLLRRIYNPANDTLSSIEICKISTGGNTFDFTTETISTNIVSLSNTNNFISVNAQIAEYNGAYYMGMCVVDQIRSGVILTTTDMLNYSVWLIPDIVNSNACYECACYVKNNSLYYAVRQSIENYLVLCKINVANKTITQVDWIPSSTSRASFFEISGNLYLAHSINARQVCNIIKINENDISGSYSVTQINLTAQYPSIASYNNKYIMIATDAIAVYARELNTNWLTTNNILSLLNNIIKNYSI